jgi:hypothetical protein
MQAAELTVPLPAQPGRTTRIAAIAIAVTALVLAITGTVALAANVLRDHNGYFNWPTETFTSDGYAIAMKSVDISHAPKWAFSDAGLNSVRVKTHSNRPLFIGIARTGDLDHYLRGTEHDDVSGLTTARSRSTTTTPRAMQLRVPRWTSRSGSSRPAAPEASRSTGTRGQATGARSL